MPSGFECRERLIKQRKLPFTTRSFPISQEINLPGPNQYETPAIFCGPGYSNIKRMPAYTMGIRTMPIAKPAARANAPMFNISGMSPKGTYRIPGSLITPTIEEPSSKMKNPGPANYAPTGKMKYKRPPAYSIRQTAKPPYQPEDMWTPPPNMYLPPIIEKKPPAYSVGNSTRTDPRSTVPGPGEHEPNFDFVKKRKPAFSFGFPFRQMKPPIIPAPNAYCEKKFLISKRTTPAPSFGIRHTQYLGKPAVHLKPSNLKVNILGT